jgi:putative intracellular protease/amidase
MTHTIGILCAPMGSEWADVVIARQHLQSYGLHAEVVSTSEDIQLYKNLDHSDRIRADRRLEDLDLSKLSGVLLAGGLIGPYELRVSPLVNKFVEESLRRVIPLAAVGHGVWLLLGSRRIQGLQVCAPTDLAFDVRRAGADLVEDKPLSTDGRLMCSRSSVEIEELCRTLADKVRESMV